MHPTGTHFNYYQVCKRKLWLFANGINMEHTSDLVYDGKLIQGTSYPQRSERYEELEMDGIKIDYYDARNKVIHEIKRSDKVERAHEWQVKYYSTCWSGTVSKALRESWNILPCAIHPKWL